MQSTFDMAELSVKISIGLIGVLCLWLGFFRIAENAGLIQILSRALEPLFLKLMPEVPRGHAAQGSMTMNIAANMLGLDNAATPMGLRAMQDLQELNPQADTATTSTTPSQKKSLAYILQAGWHLLTFIQRDSRSRDG